MKKVLLFILFIGLSCLSIFAQNNFPQALRTCESYSKTGSVLYNGEYFNISISLQNSKKGCVYKEKIFQDKGWQMLTCTFNQATLAELANSMQEYNTTYKQEIMKNDIFEAKMTTNGYIFQNYLIKPQLCNITYSKK